MVWRRTIAAAVAVLTLTWLPAEVEAGKRAARREYKRAKAAFKAGDYDKALGGYKRAYRHAPLPGFLFNIAQCYRNLSQYKEAARFFRLYLRKAPKAPNRRAVEALLVALDAKIKRVPPAGTGPSGTGPSGTGPSGTGPSGTGPSGTGPSGTGPSGTGPSGTGPSSTGPSSTGPSSDGPTVSPDGVKPPQPTGDPRLMGPTGEQTDADKARGAQLVTTTPTPPPPRSTPFYKRWWFWTGVAAVVGGGVVGAYLATRPRSNLPDTRFPVMDVSLSR